MTRLEDVMQTVAAMDDDTAELLRLADESRSDRVAGPIDVVDAVRRFRANEFDFLWLDQGQWYGYKLKAGFATLSESTRALTQAVHWRALQRSIA